MRTSIIIPTYREGDVIAALVSYLVNLNLNGACEIIVVDGQSDDNTREAAVSAGATVVTAPVKGRAAQMNYGAAQATGEVLYFVHADTFPPRNFSADILNAVACGYAIGRFQTRFDSDKFILKINAFFTRFDWFMCYGGDQTLFIEKALFDAIGGFNPSMGIMEDYDIVERARKFAKYKILTAKALVSARKYDTNSWLRVQRANFRIVRMYQSGASQQDMVMQYKKMLNYR